MATHHQEIGALAAQIGPQVAGFVHFDLDRQRGQVFAEQIAGFDPFGCPAESTRTGFAAGSFGQVS